MLLTPSSYKTVIHRERREGVYLIDKWQCHCGMKIWFGKQNQYLDISFNANVAIFFCFGIENLQGLIFTENIMYFCKNIP